jgi:hypothetical protein
VPNPPRVVSYLICFLNPTDIAKGLRQPPSAVAGPLKRASWGGYLRQTLRTMPKRRIYLPEWRRPKMWPGERIFGGECSPTTLVAVTTSYFSSRNFRQSLVLTLLYKPVGFKVIYGSLQLKGTWLYLLLLCHRSASSTAGYLR